jgi:hypothetical protein
MAIEIGTVSSSLRLVHRFLYARAAGGDIRGPDLMPLIRHALPEVWPVGSGHESPSQILADLVEEWLLLELPNGDWQVITPEQRESASVFSETSSMTQWDDDFATALALVDANDALHQMQPETWSEALDSIADEKRRAAVDAVTGNPRTT